MKRSNPATFPQSARCRLPIKPRREPLSNATTYIITHRLLTRLFDPGKEVHYPDGATIRASTHLSAGAYVLILRLSLVVQEEGREWWLRRHMYQRSIFDYFADASARSQHRGKLSNVGP